MKHAFSRLITFINHLFANVVSTFVERWLRKNVAGYVIFRDDEVVMYNHLGNKHVVMIDDKTGKVSLTSEISSSCGDCTSKEMDND